MSPPLAVVMRGRAAGGEGRCSREGRGTSPLAFVDWIEGGGGAERDMQDGERAVCACGRGQLGGEKDVGDVEKQLIGARAGWPRRPAPRSACSRRRPAWRGASAPARRGGAVVEKQRGSAVVERAKRQRAVGPAGGWDGESPRAPENALAPPLAAKCKSCDGSYWSRYSARRVCILQMRLLRQSNIALYRTDHQDVESWELVELCNLK
jgi:hypothetical protein